MRTKPYLDHTAHSSTLIKKHGAGRGDEGGALDNPPGPLKPSVDRNSSANEFSSPLSVGQQTKVSVKMNLSLRSYSKVCIQINIQMSLIPMMCLLSSNSPKGCLAIQTAAENYHLYKLPITYCSAPMKSH